MAMCDKLAEYSIEQRDYRVAARWAAASLKIDRCDEAAHRQLMRAYAADGRYSEAVRQYRQCQRLLREELGVQPAPATQQLFALLVNGEDLLTTAK